MGGYNDGELSFQLLGIRITCKSTACARLTLVRKKAGAHSKWFLDKCLGSICNGVPLGTQVRRIKIRGARGPDVQKFREDSLRLTATLRSIKEQLFSDGGGSANVGMPKSGMVMLQEVRNLFIGWKREVEPWTGKMKKGSRWRLIQNAVITSMGGETTDIATALRKR